MSFQGIDIRQSGDRLLFRALLLDADGAKVSAGTTSLYLYELQSDGTLKSHDFADNTFKTTALTTETAALTHRTGNNGGTNTGLWTAALTTLSGFTAGNVYLAMVHNSAACPAWQCREFQFAGSIPAGITGSVGGNVDGSVGSLSATAKSDIAAVTIDGAADLQTALRAILAACCNRADASTPGTVVFKARDGSTTVLTVQHDAAGSRTASVLG